MRRFHPLAVAACVFGLAATGERCAAQFGGAPAVVPAVPVVAAVPVDPAAAVARPGPFKRVCLGMEECIRKVLPTPAGQLLNNLTKPLSALTGGVIPTLDSKKPTVKELAAPGVAGASAQGKKDAADAGVRRANVRYLGSLDCRYYPDASVALADALRTDPSECVRYEAAVALSNGCCCNKVTLRALRASVSGFEPDGNPAERSARVRTAAAVGLERCLACYVEPYEPEDKKDEKKELEPKEPVKTEATKILLPPASKEAVREARETLAEFQELLAATKTAFGPQAVPTPGPARGVFDIVQAAAFEPRVEPKTKLVPAVAFTPPAAPATAMPTAAAMPKPPVVTPAVIELPDAVLATVIVPPVRIGEEADPKAVDAIARRVVSGETAKERHAAVRELVRADWREHPIVASALVAGAKGSITPEVQVDCIRHLAAHRMAHREVLAALAALDADANPWVRDEAAAAYRALANPKQ